MTEPSMEKKSSDILSVSVPPDMKLYLDKHPKINRSKLFQDAVNAIRYPTPKRVQPAILLLCVMGIIGGLIITMLAGLIFQILNQFLAFGMLLLGLTLSLISLLIFMKMRKESKRMLTSEENARL